MKLCFWGEVDLSQIAKLKSDLFFVPPIFELTFRELKFKQTKLSPDNFHRLFGTNQIGTNKIKMAISPPTHCSRTLFLYDAR